MVFQKAETKRNIKNKLETQGVSEYFRSFDVFVYQSIASNKNNVIKCSENSTGKVIIIHVCIHIVLQTSE